MGVLCGLFEFKLPFPMVFLPNASQATLLGKSASFMQFSSAALVVEAIIIESRVAVHIYGKFPSFPSPTAC